MHNISSQIHIELELSSHQLDDGFVEPGEVTTGFYLGPWDCLFHKDMVPGIPRLFNVIRQY